MSDDEDLAEGSDQVAPLTLIESIEPLALSLKEALIKFIEAEPFRPFRIQMGSGRIFEIRHPENIRVGTDMVVVFEYLSENNQVFEKFKMLGFSHVESIEHIDCPIAQD